MFCVVGNRIDFAQDFAINPCGFSKEGTIVIIKTLVLRDVYSIITVKQMQIQVT